MAYETSGPKPGKLTHAHLCIACGRIIRPEQMFGRENIRGLFECPICRHSGPANIRIVEEVALYGSLTVRSDSSAED
jgi:hypothetical protein